MAKSNERGGQPDYFKHKQGADVTGHHPEMQPPVPRRGSSTPPKHETGDTKQYEGGK